MEPSRQAAKRPRRWGRALGFRVAAVLLAVAPFALAEAVFVILDWGRPSSGEDPFVGFSSIHPLFVPDADGPRYEIARSRQAFFQPESFGAVKAVDEYRIFCLGGSTVQGRPFGIETSFTTWLEINLRAADPSRTWRVVNCGGISYASYRLVPILQEVLGYGPDLVILYTGHNEFLEDREYGHIRDIPPFVSRPCELLMETRTYNLLRETFGRSPADERPVLGPEADAMLDYKGGLEKYHRDETRRRGVIEHFGYNLRRMVGMCREAGVAVLLVNPVSSLRNCPPFKSEHRDGLTAEQLRRWESLRREAGRQLGTNPFRAVDLLRRASAIDDQHADLHYLLGRCYDAMGRPEQARRAYIRAKELDVCPLRMLEPMHRIVLDAARRSRAPLLDARKLIERRSRDGIPGGYLLLDHVHPSIPGHRLIADALTEELIGRGIVHPAAGWKRRRYERARRHLASLDDFYFARGQERLEAVRKWAAGRATLVSPQTRPRTP